MTAAHELETVEELSARIEALVHERQVLRSSGADRARLEANRLEVTRLQQRLSQALIQRYLAVA